MPQLLSAVRLFWDARLASPGDSELYQRLKPVGEAALACVHVPDVGVWEYRNGVHTYSAAMCWAAAHHLALIGESQDDLRRRARADVLKWDILKGAVTREGWLSGALDGDVADPSVLLLPQIYSQVGTIFSAYRLNRTWEQGSCHAS